MRYSGRIVASLGMLALHMAYIVYYYWRDTKIEPLDLYTTPILILVGYWAGFQYDKMQFRSESDTLTGLYNRQFVLNTFKKISSLVERNRSKLFILFIDADNFKEINDSLGHYSGDMVLKMIGEVLVSTTRKSDIVARWGGDEFLIVGHYQDEAGLQTILQRLENDLRDLSHKINIPVQVSIGSAVFPDHHNNLFELIKIADQSMYHFKMKKKEHA